MVGGDEHDVAVDLAAAVPPEQVQQAVLLPRGEQREIVLKPNLPERTSNAAEEDDEDSDERKTGAESAFAAVDAESLETSQKFPPHIMVLSSGEIFPFEVQIERDSADALWRIVGLPDNDLRIERRGQNREWIMVNQTNVPTEDEEDSRRART